jgi:hypothetical protein
MGCVERAEWELAAVVQHSHNGSERLMSQVHTRMCLLITRAISKHINEACREIQVPSAIPALHDVVTVGAARTAETAETLIVLTSNHPWVPQDNRSTVWKMVERCRLC